jgi:4-amino-4-deoxy-L-arabinose transferase-like glycosyltransferase
VRARDIVVLTLLVALVLAWPLAAPGIGTHGEAREGLVVQDLVARGHWVLPLRNGELPSKPPLFHWIAGVTAEVTGLHDWVVRFPSALGAWVVLVLVYLLGAAAGGRVAGWLAVGALAGMHSFFESATEARVDMVFVATVTVALAAFFRWYETDDRRARVACYLAVAAAVLTKGPAGAVLPGLVIGAFLLRERRLDRLRDLWSWPLVAVVLAIDLGWYALAAWTGGWPFVARQILFENVDRFVGRGVFGQNGGRSRFMMVGNLATDLLPWNLVLVWAAIRWWRGEREDAVGRFLHTWWIVILAFFTVAYGKRGVYLLPLYPAIAVLCGRALAALRERWRDLPARTLPLVGAVQPARALVGIVVVAAVVVPSIGQGVRLHKARKASLVPFAREVASVVPASAPLVADASLDASDLLVMAYRLERAIPRVPAGTRCIADSHRLATPRPGAPLVSPVAVSKRKGVPVALVHDTADTCPLALEDGNDR